MNRQDFDENVVDFLYDEMDPAQRSVFHQEIQSDPECASDAHDLRRVSQIYRSRMPDLPVPSSLTNQLLAKLPARSKRRAWFSFEWGGLLRPALAGAFVLVLTLGVLYEYKQHRDTSPVVATQAPVEVSNPLVPTSSDPGGDLKFQDIMAAVGQPRAYAGPTWRQPRFVNAGNGIISLASYGATSPMDETSNTEIYGLDQQAQNAVPTFAHQQAMRMHAMGDHKGAAEALAKLIKQYPNYPRIFEALALRIGCLYQIGQVDKARQELVWLRQNSPELAQLVEQRWQL